MSGHDMACSCEQWMLMLMLMIHACGVYTTYSIHAHNTHAYNMQYTTYMHTTRNKRHSIYNIYCMSYVVCMLCVVCRMNAVLYECCAICMYVHVCCVLHAVCRMHVLCCMLMCYDMLSCLQHDVICCMRVDGQHVCVAFALGDPVHLECKNATGGWGPGLLCHEVRHDT